MNKPYALLILSRPLNGLLTALSVGIGAVCSDAYSYHNIFLTGNNTESVNFLAYAAISATMINAFGNVINDWFDIEVDRINRPYRPLPRGSLHRDTALIFSVFLAINGILFAYLIGVIHTVIAITVCLLLIIYSRWLKNSVMSGNIVVALIASAAFPYGALAVGDLNRSWIPAVFAFLFHIGREIIKDVEDMDGDRKQGLKTLPISFGSKISIRFAAFFFIILAVFTTWTFINDTYGISYAILTFGVHLLVSYVFFAIHQKKPSSSEGLPGKLLKVAILLGLTAIIAGEFERSF